MVGLGLARAGEYEFGGVVISNGSVQFLKNSLRLRFRCIC